MNSQQLFDDLQQRGLIAQSTPLEALVERFATPQVLYCGFDPLQAVCTSAIWCRC